jgi:methyl-accepting chemotaxis protein
MTAQVNGAQRISDTLLQLGEGARQTAESLRQSSLSIGKLNSAAQSLEETVARFRLGPDAK